MNVSRDILQEILENVGSEPPASFDREQCIGVHQETRDIENEISVIESKMQRVQYR